MIAAWLLYTIGASALLFAAALAVEYLARTLSLPTRFVWFGAIVATIALSTFVLVAPRPVIAEDPATPALLGGAPIARIQQSTLPRWTIVSFVSRQPLSRVQNFIDGVRVAGARAFLPHVNIARLDRLNIALGIVAAVGSLCALGLVLVGLRLVRRIERHCAPSVVDGHAVLLSENLGPAVLGVLRTRIVLPRWVLDLSLADRQTILAHEREHAAAFDPAVLLAGAMGLALQPWNFALWAMFARLRTAIETDCDRRVLGANGDVRAYGTLLLRVFERTTVHSAPLLAFVERRSTFETRVRRLAGDRPRLVSASGIVAMLAVLGSIATASALPRPTRQRLGPLVARHVSLSAQPWQQQLHVEREEAAPPKDERGTVSPATDTRPFPPVEIIASSSAAAADPITTTAHSAVLVPHQGRTLSVESCPTARTGGICAIDGTIVIRVLDSTRVLIALRDSSGRRANTEADDIFLITSLRPIAMPQYQAILSGHIEIREGSLYVVDSGDLSNSISVAPPDSRPFGVQRNAAIRIDHPSAIAHYYGAGPVFTLEEIPALQTESVCDGPAGSCFGVNGKSMRFPL